MSPMPLAGAAALLVASSSTAEAPSSQRPEVVLFATRAAPGDSGRVRADFRQAFSRALEAAARPLFEARGWRVADSGSAALALTAVQADCRSAQDERCLARAAERLGASRWVQSSLAALPGDACEVTASLRGRGAPKRLRDALRPCTIDGLLVRADAFAAELAAGPRWRPPPTEVFSSTPLPDLHISSLPDLRPPGRVATSTAPWPALPLDEALAQYRRRAIVVFNDDEGGLRFARRGRLLGECDLRRLTGAPLDREQRVFCHGNGWMWSLVGVPAGALLAAGSFPELEQGSLPGFVGVGFGVLSAVTAAGLALGLSELGHDPESGEYATAPAELRRLAEASNRELRRELGLTEAEARLPAGDLAPSPEEPRD